MRNQAPELRHIRINLRFLLTMMLCCIQAFAVSGQVFSNGAAQNRTVKMTATNEKRPAENQKPKSGKLPIKEKVKTALPSGTSGDLLFGQGYGGYGRIIKRSFDSPPVETELSGYSDSEPDWSPDGSKIVFTSGRDRGDNSQNREIYLMNADGTNQRRLTFSPAEYLNQDPQFSPDGTKIVFTVYDNDDNEIKILNLADMSVMAVTDTDDFEYTPEWSPDGSRIIFSDGDSIYTIEPNGMNRTLLLNRLDPVNHPSYSPNGQKIVYSMQESGGENIYVADADGSNSLRVSTAALGNYSNEPAWSPDGTQIVFVGFRNNDHHIFTVNADGTQETEIVGNENEFFYNPSWQPTCATTPNVPGGFVSWWRAEGNADDSNGMNDGSIVGKTSFTAGHTGEAFFFAGANDKVEVPDDDSLDVQAGDFTLAAWVNLQTVNSDSHFIAGKSSFNDQSSSFYIGVNGDNKPFFEIYGADAKQAVIGESPDPIPTDEWYHILMRKEGASFKLFVNGEFKNEQIPGFSFDSNSVPFTIGQLDGTVSPTYTMNGAIDEVLLYNRALSETEITTLYSNSGSNNAVATWRGEDNTEDSAGANDGEWINGAPIYAAGRIGRAFDFNGNRYVRVPDNDSLDVQTGDYTLTAWVNLRSARNHFIAGKSACGFVPSRWRLSVDSQNRISSDLSNEDNTEYISFGTSQPLSSNVWHHLTLRKEGTEHKIFVDGDLKTTVQFPHVMAGNDAPFTIGYRDISCGGDFTDALIDEVNLFNRAISVEEITALANPSVTACETNAPQIRLKVYFPNPISAGRSTVATLYIPDFAPAGGTTIDLSVVGEAGAISIPPSITIPEGSNEINFTINSAITNVNKSVDIVATSGALTGRATVSIHPAVADLTVSNFYTLPTVGVSQNFTATWRTTNIGQAVTNSEYWADCVLVSPDNEYADGNNTEIGCFYHDAPLAVNQSRNVTLNNLQIPPSAVTANGTYYLFVFTNRNFGVNERELFYINNFLSRPVEVSLTPTAASITISGRALNASGNGIYQARISLTDANGATRIVMTNASGYYRFADVAAGANYVIEATHKRYNFANPTQVINVANELDELNFVATQ